MDVDKCIKERGSCRKFKSKKPDYRKIIEAIDFARLAPLAGNISTVKFILVSDKDKIKELAVACQQRFFENVDYVVVVCTDKKDCALSYGARGEKYCLQQAGAAIENFLLKIQSMGLASCWVGAFSDETVKRILDFPPEGIEPEALLPVGYAYDKHVMKQRKKPNLDSVLYFDKWKNKYMKPKDNVVAR